MKKILQILCIIFVVSGCGSTNNITNQDVVPSSATDFKEQLKSKINITKVKLNPEDKVFHPDLLGVTPLVLKTQDVELIIFELNSKDDIQSAINEFEERTATMEIRRFYEVYSLNNLLVFVVSDNVEHLKEFENEYNFNMKKIST